MLDLIITDKHQNVISGLENKSLIKMVKFPDNTNKINIDLDIISKANETGIGELILKWKYVGNDELLNVIFIKKKLDEIVRIFDKSINLVLDIPYLPNARFDRVKDREEVFTLKYFAEVLNDLKFDKVMILDPHSNVSEALINNIEVVSPKDHINKVIELTKPDVIFMPDEGASKRYSSMFTGLPYTFGIKERDWKTGDIKGYSLHDKEMVTDKKILIVDDICSMGGTFYYAAKELKEAGAGDIDLYISHCERTIEHGKLLDPDSLINNIYTADLLAEINNYNWKLKKIKIV